jgi:hypothetical protein
MLALRRDYLDDGTGAGHHVSIISQRRANRDGRGQNIDPSSIAVGVNAAGSGTCVQLAKWIFANARSSLLLFAFTPDITYGHTSNSYL